MRYLTLLLLLLVLSSCGSDGTNTGSEGSSGSGAKDSGAGTPRASAAPPEWRKLTESAQWSVREQHQVVVKDGTFYLFGGHASAPKNDVWKSTDGKVWTEVKSQGDKGDKWTPRSGHQVVVKGEAFYLFGGIEAHFNKNDVWKSTDNGASWTRESPHDADATDKWTLRKGHQVVLKGDDFYLFGGNGKNKDNPSIQPQEDEWKSTDGKKWTEIRYRTFRWTPRLGHQVVVKDNTFFLFGGKEGASYKNDVWKSTDGEVWGNGNSWIQNAGWPARSEHQVVLKGDDFYLFGGLGPNNGRQNDVWKSTDGRSWTEVKSEEDKWSARSGHQVVVKGDSIYLFGGLEKGGSYKNDVWVYE